MSSWRSAGPTADSTKQRVALVRMATKVGISSPTKAILITKKENPVGFSFAYHLFVESYFRSASSVSVSDQVPSSLSKIS
jgi:hypothetical protein